jgi:DNA-binding transcriptional MerR regulator
MQRFTISDIETLTGIKASTIRILEQRYKLVLPKRNDSLHRYYDIKELKKLLHISSLHKSGIAISRLATLTQQQVVELVKKTQAGKTHYFIFINQLIEAALDFNEYEFMSALKSMDHMVGLKNSIADVCYPYLVRITQLSATWPLLQAMNHFSTHLIQNHIITETEKLVLEKSPKPGIILFSPNQEKPELSLLFIHYLLKKNGWKVFYLGLNTNLDIPESMMHLLHINTLYLHFTANPQAPEADDYFERICKKFRNVKIIASGEGIQKLQRRFTNLTVLTSDQQIYDFLESGHRQS